MYTRNILLVALSAVSMVSAHGKVQVVTGDKGGNTTALGIKGDAVARFGPNAATEKDTTVFGGKANDPKQDGLGKTTANGQLKVADLADAMALSGNTLPQVSADGTGTITGTWRIVTSDGTANDKEGNLFAVIDETGTGKFSKGTQLVATSDMVGNGKGNVVQRAVARALRSVGIQRRATNVGADAPFTVKVPAGLKCTGTDAASGQSNFCLMKIANNNNAGPFGGTVAFQIAGAAGGDAAAASTGAAASTTAAKGAKADKAARSFQA